LPHLDLARATIERGEIVAVDCSSATGDRAGRPLGAVILIPSDAVLGRQVPSRSFPYKKTAFGYRRRAGDTQLCSRQRFARSRRSLQGDPKSHSHEANPDQCCVRYVHVEVELGVHDQVSNLLQIRGGIGFHIPTVDPVIDDASMDLPRRRGVPPAEHRVWGLFLHNCHIALLAGPRGWVQTRPALANPPPGRRGFFVASVGQQ